MSQTYLVHDGPLHGRVVALPEGQAEWKIVRDSTPRLSEPDPLVTPVIEVGRYRVVRDPDGHQFLAWWGWEQ